MASPNSLFEACSLRRNIFVIPVFVALITLKMTIGVTASLADDECSAKIQGLNINANAPIAQQLLVEIRRSVPKACPSASYLKTVSTVVENALAQSGAALEGLDVFAVNAQFLNVEYSIRGAGDERFSSALALADVLPRQAIQSTLILGNPVENEILTFRYILNGESAIGPSMRLGLTWLRDGVPISGATTSRYRLKAQDIGAQITGRLTLFDANKNVVETRDYVLQRYIAEAEYPPEIRDLNIIGDAETGARLTATYEFFDGNDGDVEGNSEFVWLRDNYAIEGATDSEYEITTQDIGKTIGVRVIPRSLDGVAGAARTFVRRDLVVAKPITVDPSLLDQEPAIIVAIPPDGDDAKRTLPTLPSPKPERPADTDAKVAQIDGSTDDASDRVTGKEATQIIIKSLEAAQENAQQDALANQPEAQDLVAAEEDKSLEDPTAADAIKIIRPDIQLAEGLTLDPNVTTKLTKLAFSPSAIFDDAALAALEEPYIGKEISVNLVREIIETIGARYLDEKYELSRALLPEQRVVDGVVAIRLVEARVGKIVLEDLGRISPRFIRRFLNIDEGGLLSLSNLERHIRLYNATNKSNLTSELAPGEEFGQTDIFLTVQEPDRVELPTFSVNNYASEVTDWRQQSFSATFNNIMRYDDEIFLAYNDSNGSESLTTSLSIPIGNEGTNISVSHSESNTKYVNDGAGASGIVGTRGASHSNSISVSQPLIFGDEYSIYASAAYGSSYSEVTLANAGLNLTESRVQKLEVALPMNYGSAVSNFSVSPSFGVLNPSSISPSFGSRSEKWMSVAKADISASRYISKYATLNLRSKIVYTEATDMLNYPSELLTVGGPGSVRAYQPSVSSGHQGYFASLELRSDLANWDNIQLPELIPYVQPYAFIDHAFAQSRQRKTQRDNFWSGAGLGVSIPSIGNFFSFDAYWATPLDRSSHETQKEAYEDELFQFSLSAKFRLP